MPTYPGLDGSELWFDELGPGDAPPPLVVLGGGACAHPRYLGDLAGLADAHRLLVLHHRGVGESQGAPGLDFWTAAGDLEQLRSHLGLDRLTVLGHSAGTRLGIAFAAQYPERVERLVLVTPPPAWLTNVENDREQLMAERRGEPAFDAAEAVGDPDTSSDETFNAWMRLIAPSAYAQWGPVEQEHDRTGWIHLDANRAFMAAQPPADLHALLREVAAPVLVVAGEKDITTGLAPVLAVAGLFPDGRLARIPDSGHFPWVEQPAAFRAAVDAFLA